MLVAGVDSSTQSTKVVLCQAEDGAIVGQAAAPHPDGTECDPELWWRALAEAGSGPFDRAEAIGVGAQQHGMVVLDESGEVIRPALLWNDVRSAPQAAELIAEMGGPQWWAQQTGSVPPASFTVTKLRWLAEHEPENAARVASVLLPHDWLTWRLSGALPGGACTDRGDASGTGYFSPAADRWLPEIAEAALGKPVALPRVAGPSEIVGRTPSGAALSAGTGDNMGAALGLGLGLDEVVVSIGTSGTAYAVAASPCADSSGAVAGFADATGRFLPLVATINAARVLTVTARMLGTDADGLSRLALAASPGADGLTLLPYLDGERSPNRPGASGVLRGLTSRNSTPENLARAAVEAVLCSLADAIEMLAGCGITARRVILIGGAARSEAVRRIAPVIFGVPVTVPSPFEYVALGAARQAAWAMSGALEPPSWPLAGVAAEYAAEPVPGVRERYAALRDATISWDRLCDRKLPRKWLARSGGAGRGGSMDGEGWHDRRNPLVSTEYVPSREDRFSFGIWTVGWQGVDVFGTAVRPPMPAERAVYKLAELGAYGVNFHDNDVFGFEATPAERDERIGAFRKALSETGLVVTTATTNLFGHPMFKDGAFTASEREVRRFALAKVMRNLDLAAELGAQTYIFWGGREGAESGAAKDIRAALDRYAEGLDVLCGYVRDQGYDIRFAIEPKPNEPRGDILLPTVGHALAFIGRLAYPEMVGVNPEVGHEEMAGLNYAHGIAQALWHGKLFHIDLNGQHGPRYDQDLRFGAGNVRGAFWVVDTLEAGGYDGPVHFDYKPPRTEDDEGVWASAAACMRNYLILREKVRAFRADPQVAEALRASGVDQLRVGTLAPGETWRDVRSADADVDALARRGLAYEHLDQLALEYLYGVRP